MIVLASQSPARIRLLKAAGLVFEARAHRAAEGFGDGSEAPQDVARRLAAEKALSIIETTPEDLVIGSDQVLECDGRLFSKARDITELRLHLQELRGRTHALHAGLACVQEGKVIFSHVSTATLKMRHFSDMFLENYLARNGSDVLSCVGGYKIEAEGIQLFESIIGDRFTIQGIPLLPLLEFLRSLKLLPA
jgi:septum formation protein